jgi:hypothetical protein
MQRQNLLGRAQQDRLPGHAKHHRRSFVLGNCSSASTPDGKQSCGAISAHSREEAARTFGSKFYREGFEEDIN